MIAVLNLFDIITGKQTEYAEYLRRVQPVLDKYGAGVILYGLTRMIYKGNCPQEYCGLVAYPDVRALRDFSCDENFLAIKHLRDDSTENYVLTVIESFEGVDSAARYIEEQ